MAIILVALTLLGSSPQETKATTAPTGFILISVDDLRVDRILRNRNGRAVAPRLRNLASKSLFFDQAISQAPWTLPSMMTVFTSVEPHRHGVTNRYAVFEPGRHELAHLPSSMTTLAEVLKRAKFDTAAFTGDAGLDGAFGFSRGFDVYFDSIPFAGYETTTPMALSWLRARKDRPFFLFLHGYDVHGQGPRPHHFVFTTPKGGVPSGNEFLEMRKRTIDGARPVAPSGDAERWRTLYDERVASADAQLGKFFDALGQIPGLLNRTLLVIMADHGEELLEHGGLDHGTTLYDEVIRVPLIVHLPDAPPRTEHAQVRLLDLMPTVLDLLGVSDPLAKQQMRGASLAPALKGQRLPALAALSETDFLFRVSKRSVRQPDGSKLILDLETLDQEVYQTARDPNEQENLANENPGLRSGLEGKLRQLLDLPH